MQDGNEFTGVQSVFEHVHTFLHACIHTRVVIENRALERHSAGAKELSSAKIKKKKTTAGSPRVISGQINVIKSFVTIATRAFFSRSPLRLDTSLSSLFLPSPSSACNKCPPRASSRASPPFFIARGSTRSPFMEIIAVSSGEKFHD